MDDFLGSRALMNANLHVAADIANVSHSDSHDLVYLIDR